MVEEHPSVHAQTVIVHSWDEDGTTALVAAAVRRKHELLANLSGIDEQSIVADMLDHVRDSYHGYNPARSAWSTFVGTIVGRRLIDLQRKETRRVARETVYVNNRQEQGREIVSPDEIIEPRDLVETIDAEIVGGADGQPTLCDWLATVYAACRRNARRYPGNLHRGRRDFSAAQAVTCGLLAAKLRYGKRAMVLLFETRPDLRDAIGFRDIPSDKWFWVASQTTRRVAS